MDETPHIIEKNEIHLNMKNAPDTPKILVVEDSKVTIKVLTNYLASMGIEEPLLAETGKQALEIFKKERPDIVLLDARLPDIDGFEVARKIRKMEGEDEWSAIIFLTAMNTDEDLARGIAAGGGMTTSPSRSARSFSTPRCARCNA